MNIKYIEYAVYKRICAMESPFFVFVKCNCKFHFWFSEIEFSLAEIPFRYHTFHNVPLFP